MTETTLPYLARTVGFAMVQGRFGKLLAIWQRWIQVKPGKVKKKLIVQTVTVSEG